MTKLNKEVLENSVKEAVHIFSSEYTLYKAEDIVFIEVPKNNQIKFICDILWDEDLSVIKHLNPKFVFEFIYSWETLPEKESSAMLKANESLSNKTILHLYNSILDFYTGPGNTYHNWGKFANYMLTRNSNIIKELLDSDFSFEDNDKIYYKTNLKELQF